MLAGTQLGCGFGAAAGVNVLVLTNYSSAEGEATVPPEQAAEQRLRELMLAHAAGEV